MATTCVLGHAWNEGLVLCPRCGFGRRNLPEQAGLAQPQAATAQASVPAQAVAYAQTPVATAPVAQRVAATVPAMATVGGPPTEQILSPDGQWAWNGLSWVPAIPPPPAPLVDETSVLPAVPEMGDAVPPRGGRRRAPRGRVREPRDRAPHRVDPRLLLGGLLVVAALVAGDLALGLPPLGHPATAAPTVVVHHPSPVAVRDAAAKRTLVSGAKAETAYRAKSGLYSSRPRDLRTAGMPAVAAPAVFSAAAHHGTGFCLVAGAAASGTHFFLYDSVQGGLQRTVYPTAAAAAKGCSQTG